MALEIIEKLRKVLALTSSPQEGEAQAATAMLQKLLTQYNLSVADLERKGGHAAPQIKEAGHDLGKAAFRWKLDLADSLAEHFYCVPLVNRTTKTVAFVGRPDNVESMQMLYGWIIDQIKRIATEDRRVHISRTGEHIDPLRWQVNFGVGAVERLTERMRQLRDQQVAASAGITSLVISHAKEASDYLESKYGYRRDGRPTAAQAARQAKWDKEKADAEELKATDLDAYYAKYPWERPLTAEQEAAQAEANARYWKKEAARERRNAARRTGITRWRAPSSTDERKDEQAYRARGAGRQGADRVNLTPFVTGHVGERKKVSGQ